MAYDFDRELDRFERWGDESFPGLHLERLCDYGWLLKPLQAMDVAKKDIALTLIGLVHGNERAGLAVLNRTMAHIAAGTVVPRVTIAMLLGNPWAARQNRRFLERDLNRSFDRTTTARPDSPAWGQLAFEERRALELEPVLARTAYILDFHQTIRRSEQPFFIFPYSAASFNWARRLAPHLPVVTHWGQPFSTAGRCTDEFVNRCGGIGMTLELGQNGFDPYQIGAGTEIALTSIRLVAAAMNDEPLTSYQVAPQDEGEIYTWAAIVPWPSAGLVELRPDWHNFKPLQTGDVIGTVDGLELVAPLAGRMLFPKYLSHSEQLAQLSRPTELCRILKTITRAQLPQSSEV